MFVVVVSRIWIPLIVLTVSCSVCLSIYLSLSTVLYLTISSLCTLSLPVSNSISRRRPHSVTFLLREEMNNSISIELKLREKIKLFLVFDENRGCSFPHHFFLPLGDYFLFVIVCSTDCCLFPISGILIVSISLYLSLSSPPPPPQPVQ